MTVKALISVRHLNLVAPLPYKGTAMHTIDTTAQPHGRSSAIASLIGENLWTGDIDSANIRSPRPITLGIRTSTTATRTRTTRTTPCVLEPSADSNSITFERLLQAYLDCRKSKRNTASARAFEANLESNLLVLFDELQSGQYVPGRSICFVITRPKPREVWAAEFRDRVVHHLLYNFISPRFHAKFIANSCACIPGRGTLYGGERLEHSIRSITHNWSRPAYYLKMDLANFFVAIDKHTLFAQIAKHVTEPQWQALARTILFHDPRKNVLLRGAPATIQKHGSDCGKRLYTSPPAREPLSEEAFSAIYADWFMNRDHTALDLLRIIEAAHGIGVKQ